MKIKCPSCSMIYDIDVNLLNKKVECGECFHKFKAIPLIVFEIKSYHKDEPLGELRKKITQQQKMITKFADQWSQLQETIIYQTEEASYDFADGEQIDFGEAAANLQGTSEELLEYIDGLLEDRKEYYKNWNDNCFGYKRPSKEQYEKLVNYLDKKFGYDWAGFDEFCRMQDAVSKFYPELRLKKI